MALGDYPDVSAVTRLRVRELCQQMNYKPRRKGARRRAREAAARAATENRTLRIVVSMVGYEQKLDLQSEALLALSRDVDGIFLDGFVRPALLDYSATLQVPAVLMGNTYGDPILSIGAGCQVTSDMRGMGHLAARTLIKAGHRRIAFVCTRVFENLYYEQWLAGFRHAHADAGVPLDPALLLITGNVENKHVLAARTMISVPNPPTAVVVPDAGTAQTLLETLRALGREMPKEAVVIGGSVDELAVRHLSGYPMIGIDLDRLARATLGTLVRVIRAGEKMPAQKILIPFETANLPVSASGA
jgi:LacI family transcriptional regulator